ncbi:hypothetical protein KUV89_09440 [Marinobacter hydrocarbonoclasticus]|nr:hypothetical protein [Marinobacter nauticus]
MERRKEEGSKGSKVKERLVIHAGLHKTATTSIQKFLLDSKEALSACDYALFSYEPAGELSEYGHANHWVRHYGQGPSFDAEVNISWLKYLSRIEENNVIFSSEHLSWINSYDNIEFFRRALEPFFRSVTVVFYLRRQDEQLMSHHQQGSKHYRWCEQLYYGTRPAAYPEHTEFDEYLDYEAKIDKWAEAFGEENVIVRVFDRELLHNNDVISDFCQTIGLNVEVTPIFVNESRGKYETVVGHIYNEMKISHLDPLRIAILKGLQSDEKLLPTRDEAKRVYEQYRERNRNLNQRFRISERSEDLFAEDFDKYPTEADPLLYLDVLRAVLAQIHTMTWMNSGDVDALRDAANALQNTHPELARRLIVIAKGLRPTGPKINELFRKLNTIES